MSHSSRHELVPRAVMQNVLYQADGIGNGNCLAACLASLLNLPLWMVPPFEQMFGRDDWGERRAQWLRTMFGLRLINLMNHQVDKLPEYYIACGPSLRGVQHATIYRKGELYHDPHHSATGIQEVLYTYHLMPVLGESNG